MIRVSKANKKRLAMFGYATNTIDDCLGFVLDIAEAKLENEEIGHVWGAQTPSYRQEVHYLIDNCELINRLDGVLDKVYIEGVHYDLEEINNTLVFSDKYCDCGCGSNLPVLIRHIDYGFKRYELCKGHQCWDAENSDAIVRMKRDDDGYILVYRPIYITVPITVEIGINNTPW